MKKLFITTAIAAMFSASVFADGTKKATTVNVSYTVVNEFSASFAEARDITWTVNRNFQKADFTMNGVKTTAFYNLQGAFVALTESVTAKAIPAKAQKEIAEQYKGYTATEMIVVQNNTELNPDADETGYFVALKNNEKEILVKITPELHVEFYKAVN
jgi:hypothetical protein